MLTFFSIWRRTLKIIIIAQRQLDARKCWPPYTPNLAPFDFVLNSITKFKFIVTDTVGDIMSQMLITSKGIPDNRVVFGNKPKTARQQESDGPLQAGRVKNTRGWLQSANPSCQIRSDTLIHTHARTQPITRGSNRLLTMFFHVTPDMNTERINKLIIQTRSWHHFSLYASSSL